MSLPRQIWRAPAVRAALLQALAFPLMLALVYLLARAGLALPLFAVALLQGALAAALSWRCGLAPWWRAIQLLFAPALLAASALHLPPLLFLLAFIFLLGLYWSTFRTQVPFYPSGPAVWDAVAQLLPAQRPARLVDIGSGLGGLVLALARRRPDCSFSGIELAPLPWLCSVLRARLAGSAARFLRGDYEKLDFAQFDAVFAYLSPAAMPALWQKAAREMRPGTMLLSYEFCIAGQEAQRIIAATPSGPALYVWYF
ncbi:class I SAM-dependent methyltransferase [Janthinobacterium fluminis]|uniref:Methyltransferase domain-containing protein n=1 Tax=Janthinobacterium fluminis TaxID=2987524 RepID=A0ABT5K0M5_9BURK|nr:methyltransferase domain-containing protein [Janthinobacterium fluminis]MDC8758528.1 methyltransferase domain-containing protein [Janthinobacterium fluminis]